MKDDTRVVTTIGLASILESRSIPVKETGVSLECALRARVNAGRAAWPTLDLAETTFIAHLGERVHGGELPPLAHAADLWLACACTLGLPGAAVAFDRTYRRVIERAVARMAGAEKDDVAQHVLAALLVQQGENPARIAEYGGRAPLQTWLKTVASRTALNRRRRRDARPHESLSGIADEATRADPALEIVRARYAPVFERALRLALDALEPRQRMLLRMHAVDRWSIDRVAKAYEISRSTAARWVSAARQALRDATRARLLELLPMSPREIESLLCVLQSDLLEVSLVRLLAEEEQRT
jgi:RNA polymerase sigma-70 factor (ECF subfamily)